MRGKSHYLRADPEALSAIAEQFFAGHLQMASQGYGLGSTSALWRSKGNTVTARLVYRRSDRDAIGITTITMIVKGIPVRHASVGI